MSKYAPNVDFVRLNNQASTIAHEARFNSLKDRNRIEREQVGPVSYNVKNAEGIYRPHINTDYVGKFKRDYSSRLDSCTLYIKTKDVTPAPTETDNSLLQMQKDLVQARLNRMSD